MKIIRCIICIILCNSFSIKLYAQDKLINNLRYWSNSKHVLIAKDSLEEIQQVISKYLEATSTPPKKIPRLINQHYQDSNNICSVPLRDIFEIDTTKLDGEKLTITLKVLPPLSLLTLDAKEIQKELNESVTKLISYPSLNGFTISAQLYSKIAFLYRMPKENIYVVFGSDDIYLINDVEGVTSLQSMTELNSISSENSLYAQILFGGLVNKIKGTLLDAKYIGHIDIPKGSPRQTTFYDSLVHVFLKTKYGALPNFSFDDNLSANMYQLNGMVSKQKNCCENIQVSIIPRLIGNILDVRCYVGGNYINYGSKCTNLNPLRISEGKDLEIEYSQQLRDYVYALYSEFKNYLEKK